jgi:hypothetical protein
MADRPGRNADLGEEGGEIFGGGGHRVARLLALAGRSSGKTQDAQGRRTTRLLLTTAGENHVAKPPAGTI